MASNSENKDVKTVDSGLEVQSPVPSTPGRSTTLPSPAGAGTTALSSSPNTSKSRFANNTPTAADPIGTPAKSAVSSTSAASASLGLGTKSMPGSRRTSAIPGVGQEDGAFGLDKLSLGDNKGKEDGSDAKSNTLSPSSAALDLAHFKQTSSNSASSGQRFGQRPFDSGLKTSEWPQFGSASAAVSSIMGPKSANNLESVTAPSSLDRSRIPQTANPGPSSTGAGTPLSPDQSQRASPATSAPTMVDSIASLPAMPSRSVPGTPGAPLTAGPGAPSTASGLSGFSGFRRSAGPAPVAGAGGPVQAGIAGGQPLEGLTPAQRGFSNPDLAKAFNKGPAAGGFNPMTAPRAYGQADPLYAGMDIGNGVAPLGGQNFAGGYDNYGFDDDNFGSGALYSGNGNMNMKSKRADMDREYNRFAGMRLEDLQGDILALCKDQHGCRYLQKKLEEEVPEHRDMIFRETYGHFPELMTDPFGNYLCQKLLEYSTDEQRNVICESVANDLVGISLNMHGTRAVQKMIDFLSNPRRPEQIRSIILALSLNVVSLIKDLNGNHVIQKCLNRLIPEDNQFIYNAVAAHCVEVATHRHGCCVLQRCIDHAADSQRVQLVTEITYHALTLVQDPFGNYVVQYVLDLNDVRFSEPLIRQFVGNVCVLSVQKFSSNVIEKCIRVADPELRKILVGELLNRSRLEKLLRDSFANYVVQTALDYADPSQRMLLVECIRPILPMIRNTPYGKRIQSKLQREQMGGGHQDHYSGGGGSSSGGGGGRDGGNSNYGGHQGGGMMSLGGNMHSNNYMGGNGGGHGGRGGYHSQPHPRHLGHHSMHHPNALSEVYGQHQQGMGAYGGPGYQNGMGGAYPMGFDPMARGQFGGQEHNHGPQFGAQTPGGFAPNAADSNFSPAGFAAVPVSAQTQPENGNLAGMMPLENANVGGYPQQGYAPYM
ncbi:hypothetical protein QFC22_005275 [Naganishia vaughanmartiniae]|uniref:Uncharacterized protein n=1 Tax=Naganishia vaughanmartiniae TaxID=1424756 RepID=A0ACC2WWJ7_9TREE|nr:hypothetical protein QFC22_005275 [Naganishia vaughanmartiniae]